MLHGTADPGRPGAAAPPSLAPAGSPPALRAIAALVLLLAPAVRADEAEVASEFLAAFRRKDEPAQQLLAVRPFEAVEYAGVLERLLARGEREAAEALVLLRSGAPDGPGLARLAGAGRASPAQTEALARARAALEARRPGEALDALARAGSAPEESYFAALLHATRGEALLGSGREAEAAESFAAAAAAAERCGWLQQAARMARKRHAVLRSLGSDARASLDAAVAATAAIDDRRALVPLLSERAARRAAAGDARGMREDVASLRRIATEAGDDLGAARHALRLAQSFQFDEGMPARALALYEEALPLLVAKGTKEELDAARFNSAVALTQLARYAEALARLDEVGGLPDRKASQIAYLLRRQGRLERAVGAYHAALALDPGRRAALLAELGELHLLRSDYEAARAAFAEAGEKGLGGLAAVAALRGDPAESERLFEEAMGKSGERGRVLLRRAAVRRGFGDYEGALADARDAIREFESRVADFPSAGAAWALIADVQLLAGDEAKAAEASLNAAIVFFRIRSPEAAVPAYLRAALLLFRTGKREEALERLSAAETVAAGDPPLLSGVRRVRAFFEPDPCPLLEEAVRLAGTDERALPAALSVLALADPASAPDLADRFLALLDARPEEAPELRAPLDGEDPWAGPRAAARELARRGDAGRLLPLLQRIRREKVVAAFGGREPLLAAAVPEEVHARWRAARARLLEARAEGAPTEAAEVAAREALGECAAFVPFALAPPLGVEEVRGLLGADEALVCVDEEVTLVVSRRGAEARPHDRERPLEAFAALLEGVSRLAVVADGLWAAYPFETSRWGDGPLGAKFRIRYLPTAEALRGGGAPAAGAPRAAGPLLARLDRPASARLGGRTPLLWLRESSVPGPILVRDASLSRGGRLSGETLAALAQALLLRGAGAVAIPLLDAPPPSLLERLSEEAARPGASFEAALFETKRRAASEETLKDPKIRSSLVLYGT